MEKAPSSWGSPTELTPLSKLKNRTPLCGHLYLLISAVIFLAALMVFVKKFLWAWSIEHRERLIGQSEFWKLVICRHRLSSRSRRESKLFMVISFLISSKMIILAFSKVDLRAMTRKRLNSFLDEDPEPSEILFDIDIPEPLSWSANRCNFLFSSSSAISNSSLAILITNRQIHKC